MFPLWDVAIAPVLRAGGAKRIVEIGALRGENTVQVFDVLGDDGELHVIDPVPAFDPDEHASQFDGAYIFHRALSVDVLGDLPPMDAALIDGDHNWYTVYNECRLLAEVARAAGRSMPVMILHDVLWPYGRRDLYYDPDTVPAEHRQPFAQRGMRPGRSSLLARGGLNAVHHNAIDEGGDRNGVMTGLDDFIAGYDRPVRCVVLPIYFGLAVVAEEEDLARRPELAAAFDRLESPEVRAELLELAEDLRLRAMVHQHSSIAKESERADRAVVRLLEVTKASLLNEHYLDHERRFEYLAQQLERQANIDPVILRDPTRHQRPAWRALVDGRSGPAGPNAASENSFVPYTAMGRTRLDHLHRRLDEWRSSTSRQGGEALVEVGTGRGGGAMFMRAWLDAHDLDGSVWVVDRFRAAADGVARPTMPTSGVSGFRADLNLVRDGFDRFGLLDDRVHFAIAEQPEAVDTDEIGDVGLLRIGSTEAERVGTILRHLHDLVVPGGTIVVETGGSEQPIEAIEAFMRERSITTPLERIDHGTVCWQRAPENEAGDGSDGSTHQRLATTFTRPAGQATIDLTVVVVFYNMRREAERTLRSLSRAYQEQLDGVTYEVLAIENGSAPNQRIGREFVESFGPEFRYIDMGEDADPTPVSALNRGVAEGRGGAFALMIDGAHVLTPGVLHHGLLGLQAYSPAIVCTQQWYCGPGQQSEAMDGGYDQAYEDRLFDAIEWPSHGYRLFEIGHFIGDRDWLDGMWESNCLFAQRSQLEQVGAFDPAFDMAGGGYANLELYERLGSSPDITVVSIIGEGSFHQTHGGTTTNQPDPAERRSRVFSYGQHYAGLRGRPFQGPGRRIHYVGRFSDPAARRSKSRAMNAKRFADAVGQNVDGIPETPAPVAQELTTAFTEAVWQSLPWERATWMGQSLTTPPTDLFTLQQLIVAGRPDVIVETNWGEEGRTLFLAELCELLGHGRVVSVASGGLAVEHPLLTVVDGVLGDRKTAKLVRAELGGADALVVLGSRSNRPRTVAEFDAVASAIPVDGYAVVLDTIVNGNPVWPGFGPGPAEAVKAILRRHGDFAQDTSVGDFSLSFCPGGFLRRVAVGK